MSCTDRSPRCLLPVLLGHSACEGPTGATPSTAVDPWTTLGEPWRQSTMSADSPIGLSGDLGCYGQPRKWNSYYPRPEEWVVCAPISEFGSTTHLSSPESATGIDPDLGSDDDLRGQPVGFGHTLAAVGDVTGDGTLDLAIGTRDYGRLDLGPVQTVIDTPDWNFVVYAGWVLTGTPGADRAVGCGDVTRDGQPDLCTTAGLRKGPVGQGPPPTASWPGADRLTAGDFAGDGVTGLVLADDTALWWLADPGALTGAVDLDAAAAAAFDVAAPVTALAAGDLDGDGGVDLVVGTTTAVVVGHLSPTDGFTVTVTLPGPVDDLAVGDFDGDGALDLAVGGDAEVRWFAGPLDAPTEPTDVLRGPGWPSDHFGQALAAGDPDQDGTWLLGIAAPNPDPEGLGAWWWLDGLSR